MRPDELPAVVELVNQVFCVATGRPPTMGEQFPQLFSPENADNLFVFTDRGRPVSHVGLWMGGMDVHGLRLPTASMGSVCTLPEARSQGLADRLVQLSLERARAEGRPLVFISGARSLYRRNGAHPAGRFRRLHLSAADVPAGGTAPADGSSSVPPGPASLPVTLRPTRIPADVPILAALHQQEPVRWHRALDDWPALVKAAGFATVLLLRQEIWLVEVGTEPAACWVTGSGPSMPGDLMALEFFGSRPALAASLPHLFRAAEAERLHVPVLEGDPLVHALAAAGWVVPDAPVEALPGTVVVTDWPLLWRLLAPYREERLPARWARARAFVSGEAGGPAGAEGTVEERARRYGLKTPDGETWEVEGEEALVRALFGAGVAAGGDLVPAGHPLAGALPIRLPWPQGLNYV
ncbi:hypothetical protein LIP_2434 [Limnochorda pilosa]|uniref:N-acetyltransferase domain-containing protein n=1 Tax=Limnochorda pilosa TaxID=1555112 RepID=A0A0K2SME5_LIMPI|nr:hypothetical protein LIP_2434 [Limnochorda pilosa]